MAASSRFEDRVAVVTGGASGIGLAIARRLVEEGAAVAVGDANAESLGRVAAELGERVEPVRVDVRVESEVEELVQSALRRFGRVDLGFNAAGLGGGGPILEMEEETWDLVVDVCLKGVMLAVKHEARAMVARGGGGAIVNVASLNSHVPSYGGSAYTCAKAAVEMLGKNASLELAEHGIRVNTISPGLTQTPLTTAIFETPGAVETFYERIPLRRTGTPEDMAAAALFLASDDASYVSGSNLFVDGGWEWSGYPDTRPFREEFTRAREAKAAALQSAR